MEFFERLGGILCGNGRTSHTKAEASRFTFRGGASDFKPAFCVFFTFYVPVWDLS